MNEPGLYHEEEYYTDEVGLAEDAEMERLQNEREEEELTLRGDAVYASPGEYRKAHSGGILNSGEGQGEYA